MKNLAKAAVLTAAVALVSQAAYTQTAPQGDFVFGFTSTSAGVTKDYTIDLGSFSAMNGSGSITQLGSLINSSTLSSTFNGGALNVGVTVGVETAHTGDYMAITIARTGNNGLAVPGTETAPTQPSSGNFVTAAATANAGILLGTPLSSDPQSFTTQADTLTTGTVANNLGTSFLSPISGSTISLDLFETTRLAPSGRSTPASAFAYEGQFNLDLSNPSNPMLQYVPAGVPEPSTVRLMGGAAVLAFLFRRLLPGRRVVLLK